LLEQTLKLKRRNIALHVKFKQTGRLRMCTPSRRLLRRTVKLASSAGTIAALALAMAVPAVSQETSGTDEVFQLTTVIGLNNTGIGNLPNGSKTFFSFDISWVDPVLNKYYLADRSNKTIDILDLSTSPPTLNQVVNTKFQGFTGNNDTSGPDGLATINNHTEVWVGDVGGTCFPDPNPACGPGQVWVLNTDASVKTLPGGVANPIPVGGKSRADEFCYDPKDNLVMIASPAESPPFVTFISTTSYKVVGKLVFDGAKHNGPNATNGLEQCGWSPSSGKFYQNVPEIDGPGNDTAAGAVAVINPHNMKVERLFPIPLEDCAGPQGMAIGPNDQILEGCNAKSPNGHRNTVVLSQKNGSVLAVLQDLGGADEVWFNEGDGHYIIPSCNTGCRTPPVPFALTAQEVLGIVDANTLQLDQTVFVANQDPNFTTPTSPGNPRTIHSVAGDPNNKQIILPIPAVGGIAPHFNSSLCDKTGAGITVIGTPSTAVGCIAILAAPFNNDDLKVAHERGHSDHQE
jgi:hypothetical protein